MVYDPGDLWTPKLTVRDAAGALAAATVVVSAVSPSGAVTSPAVANPSLGIYTATVPLPEAGLWTANWTVSGAVTGAESQHAYVRVLGSNIVGLADVKTHLNIEDTEDDDELDFFVTVANEWIATRVPSASRVAGPVQLATRELVRHWWDTQRGPSASTLDADGSLGLLGFSIPTRVKELLAPYLPTSTPPAAVGSFPDAATYWPDPIPW